MGIIGTVDIRFCSTMLSLSSIDLSSLGVLKRTGGKVATMSGCDSAIILVALFLKPYCPVIVHGLSTLPVVSLPVTGINFASDES